MVDGVVHLAIIEHSVRIGEFPLRVAVLRTDTNPYWLKQ